MDPDGRLVWFGIPLVYWLAGGAAVTADTACVATNCGQAVVDVVSSSSNRSWWNSNDNEANCGSNTTASGCSGSIDNSTQVTFKDTPRQREYEKAKSFCDTPPPPEGRNKCATLSNQIKHAKECISLYKAWDAKWGNRHEEKIQNWENRQRNLAEEHRRECTNK
ncbi:hypothetical protein VQ643_16035 [Pseudomonas sp. F1_0610]|uniref:hypothetical protein n=1 Tax=Pseudomonas sp. F1_0610 TaxID=3114284 RepID=UPI0039C061F7